MPFIHDEDSRWVNGARRDNIPYKIADQETEHRIFGDKIVNGIKPGKTLLNRRDNGVRMAYRTR
jgi:hypothetical protein